MSNPTTFFWHDYETFGINPRRDRPSQFAGIRTDSELNIIGEPLMVYCQPAADCLPHPEACLITGITPQRAQALGIPEWQFIEDIHRQMSQANTCNVGYNSIRFDDEVTRFTLWRNFFDPYQREWRDGCSRWDLIDVVRLCHALRPDGIHWPKREDGLPSFKLEELAKANNLSQERAHDALSDVYATIDLAKLLKTQKPRLYDYALKMKNKAAVADLIDLNQNTPLLHVSGKIPAEFNCLTLWMPLLTHHSNRNEIMGYDLRNDPTDLIELPVEDIHERLYTPKDALPEDVTRIALKSIHLNKSPMLAKTELLDDGITARCQLDLKLCRQHYKIIRDNLELIQSKLAALQQLDNRSPTDAEQALYAGFVQDADKHRCEQIRRMSGDELATQAPIFDDPRLNTLLFRYRARHFPDSLSGDEQAEWDEYKQNKYHFAPEGELTYEEYQTLLASLQQAPNLSEEQRNVLLALAEWPNQIGLG